MSASNLEIQNTCRAHLVQAIALVGLTAADVGLAGDDNMEPCYGAYADFNTEGSARRVHVYQDDDGELMIDAMDCGVGSPAPAAFSRPLLIAYLVWATGTFDQDFLALSQAASPVAL